MNLKDLIEDYGDYEVEDVEEIKKLLSKKKCSVCGKEFDSNCVNGNLQLLSIEDGCRKEREVRFYEDVCFDCSIKIAHIMDDAVESLKKESEK